MKRLEKIKELQDYVVEEFGKFAAAAYKKIVYSGLWESEEKLIRRYFRKGSSVLDIGCGTGRTTLPLVKMGYKVTPIDKTPEMIEAAKDSAKSEGLKIDYQIGDATKLRFKNNSFDNAIFSFCGWDQIPGWENRVKALKEAYRVLKPGGFFILTTHSRDILSEHFFFWIWQWIRMYILRYIIRLKLKEVEFGDRFFKREPAVKYSKQQYIHIPQIKEAKYFIKDVGFKLVLCKRRFSISPEEAKKSKTNCYFLIGKKKLTTESQKSDSLPHSFLR